MKSWIVFSFLCGEGLLTVLPLAGSYQFSSSEAVFEGNSSLPVESLWRTRQKLQPPGLSHIWWVHTCWSNLGLGRKKCNSEVPNSMLDPFESQHKNTLSETKMQLIDYRKFMSFWKDYANMQEQWAYMLPIQIQWAKLLCQRRLRDRSTGSPRPRLCSAGLCLALGWRTMC